MGADSKTSWSTASDSFLSIEIGRCLLHGSLPGLPLWPSSPTPIFPDSGFAAYMPSLFLSLLEPLRTSLKLLSSYLSSLSHCPDVILKPRTVLTTPISCSSHLFLFYKLAHIPKHFWKLLFMHLYPKWSLLIFLNLSFNQQSNLPKIKI